MTNPVHDVPKNRASAKVLITALAFAALTALLLHGSLFRLRPMGVGVTAAVLLYYGAVFACVKKPVFTPMAVLLALPIASAAAAFALFSNGLILFLNLVMLTLLLAVQTALLTGAGRKPLMGRGFLPTLAHGAFVMPFAGLPAAARGLLTDEQGGRRKVLGGLLAGLAVSLAVLPVLALLLMAGDMVFGRMVTELISWQTVWDAFSGLCLLAVLFALTASLLAVALRPRKQQSDIAPRPGTPFPTVALILLLGLCACLMLAFSAVQVIYLFGGAQLPYGITYSEYARSGFFQLCGAAALVFALIAISAALTRGNTGPGKAVISSLNTLLGLSVLLLLVSAFWRMVLYEQEYLFTRLRLYTQFFMVMLAVADAAVLVKLWVKKLPLFGCLFWTVTVSLCALTWFNVDGFIARTNLAYAAEPDHSYLLSLSCDALPHYAHTLTPDMFINSQLSPRYEEYEQAGLQEQYGADWDAWYEEETQAEENAANLKRLQRQCGSGDIRSFSLGRSRAAACFEQEPLASILRAVTDLEAVTDALHLDVTPGQTLACADTHGGLNGDGVTAVILQFDEAAALRMEDVINDHTRWHDLPLPQALQTAAYGDDGARPILLPEEEDFPTLPAIANGRYYFEDRHPNASDPYDPEPLHSRSSYNFVLALWDADSRTLYFFQPDT